jgi:hypothetical protein
MRRRVIVVLVRVERWSRAAGPFAHLLDGAPVRGVREIGESGHWEAPLTPACAPARG